MRSAITLTGILVIAIAVWKASITVLPGLDKVLHDGGFFLPALLSGAMIGILLTTRAHTHRKTILPLTLFTVGWAGAVGATYQQPMLFDLPAGFWWTTALTLAVTGLAGSILALTSSPLQDRMAPYTVFSLVIALMIGLLTGITSIPLPTIAEALFWLIAIGFGSLLGLLVRERKAFPGYLPRYAVMTLLALMTGSLTHLHWDLPNTGTRWAGLLLFPRPVWIAILWVSTTVAVLAAGITLHRVYRILAEQNP